MTYSQKQGLSSPNIHKIIQDKYNFLWIATQDGLNRFDGNQFVQYNYGQKHSRQLFSSDIRDVIIDSISGLLWVICHQGGINAINIATGDCVESFPYPTNGLSEDWKISAAYFRDKIFIGSSNGLTVFDIRSRKFINNLLKSKNDEAYTQAVTSDIRTISINKNGIMALGVFNKGVFFYDLNTLAGYFINQTEIKKTTASAFWPICSQFANEDTFFVSTQNGLFTIDCKNGKVLNYLDNSIIGGIDPIGAMMLADNGDMLLAGNKLVKVNVRKSTSYSIRPNFLELESWFTNITSVFQDGRNNIWIGSRQGLCLVKSNELAFRAVKNNLAQFRDILGHVFAVAVINKNAVLVGTKDGLFSINKNSELKQVYNNELVQNIVRITKDEFLISGYNGTCLFSNGEIEKLVTRYPELSGYQNWQFNSFVRVNDSINLLGSESNNGVLEWNTRSLKVKRLYTGSEPGKQLPSDIVNSIFLNSKGEPMILSEHFISIYDPQKQQIRSLKIDNAQGTNMQMQETSGSYWIASYGIGLIETDYTLKIKKIYTTKDGLSNTGLYSIFNYKDSILFLTSNLGISAFNIKTKKISRYYEEDGLQNNTFEEASRDTFNRTFFAGGADGYVKIIPQNLSIDPLPPLLYFTKMTVEGSNIKYIDTSNLTATTFTIPSGSAQVKVFFSGLHFSNAARVTYEYKIKELGNYWINLNSQNFVSLIGLSPGKYHLQVKAANEDGVWSEPKTLLLIFQPKWYQTWLFTLAIVLLVALLLYGLYRYRIRQILKVERIRQKLSSDLHDDIGSTLNSVNLFAKMATLYPENKEYMPRINAGVQDAITGVRDIIW